MMVVPVDANVDKTQHVTHKYGKDRTKGIEIPSMRHFHLKHHDGYYDCKHSITECFQSVPVHKDPCLNQNLFPRVVCTIVSHSKDACNRKKMVISGYPPGSQRSCRFSSCRRTFTGLSPSERFCDPYCLDVGLASLN
jgi:hypothetical protein